ncbi:Peptidyl-prolyl cis-trans isomerase D [Candidatus Entotheonellaceae bacterium PAL068K]
MLQQMRRAQGWMIKGVLWAVVLAFVVTIFYSWGVRSGSGPTRSDVATVLGEAIGVREFQRVQNTLYQTYRNAFRNQPNMNLREQFNFREMAVAQIARQRLQQRLAQDNGLEVTDAELYNHIAAIPTFQEQGRFAPQRYKAVLGSQVPPIALQQFEAEQRQALLLNKLQALVRATVQVTNFEVEQAYRQEQQQVAVRYVTLVPSLFKAQVQITDQELQAYYDTHKNTYREPEQRQIRYVTIPLTRFHPRGEISQDDIAEYYAAHPEAFQRQEQVRVRHILFKVAQDASQEQDAESRAKADAVLAELRDGADFAALAEAHTDDTATADKGGDLGFFSRGQMVKSFEEAAFALPVGQVSDVVRTPFGYHILRVEDKTDAEVKPLLEVRQEIIAKVREEKARDAALAFVDDLMVALEEAPDQFAALAAQHELALDITPLVAANGRVANLEGVADFVQRAFALVGPTVETLEGADGTHYIFQVAEVRPSTILEFAAVSDRVKTDLQGQKSAELARKTADEWAAQVLTGTPLAELASSLQVQVVETDLFTRKDPIPQLGRSTSFNQTAFDLPTGEAGAAHESVRHFVIQVTARQAADMQTYETERAAYRQQQLRQKRQQILVAFQNAIQTQYQQLRQAGEIVVNPQYVF